MKKLFTIVVLLWGMTTIHSQWNPNTAQNLLVTDPGESGFAFSERMSDGKTYIAFWKEVGAPTNFELWLQILDQNGNKQLGNNGILISNQIPMGTYIASERTAVDSSDNLYIGLSGTENNSAYIFKITPQGTSVWPNGINIGQGYTPEILPLSNGDIIASYQPLNQEYAKVQRFSAGGQPVWASPIEIMTDDLTKNTAPADLFELPNNEFEIIFHQVDTGIYSHLFAQKLNFDGTILWNTPKQILTKGTNIVNRYSGVVDGNAVYYGLSVSENFRFDAYLQRINSDGSLPWGADGVDFDVNETNYEMGLKVSHTPNSPYIWAISQYSNPSQTQNGEYVQKFDKQTGARLLTDNAKQVFPIDSTNMYHIGDLHLINDNPFFVVQKKNDFNDESLNAVLLDNNGDFAWQQQYIPMATYPAEKSFVSSLKPINGQNVIVFHEEKSTDANPVVYAQSLVLPTLGTDEVHANHSSVSIYPNPVADIIHVKGVKDQKFNIYNTVSQSVKRGEIKQGKINVQDLSKGIYILKIGDQKEGYKFIKE
ncbi:T9SS type A sorting domain-containing protein [Chryseobacterium sp. ERMR1:04]|uniref:T9SS type A sorting domain-containing protein n=1 Tax=Chryseobacterium sp. ERMR1:04 TaxID=1705393 RepID=UPI001364C58E|nr:T9SS type A sorting domain-containing protein [Chryseobacterium sp. ERMR1:04]